MRRRRLLQIALALLVLGVLGSVLGFAPFVRAALRAQAERRGATVEAGVVRPGWGRVWLRDVVVRLPEVPALLVHLDALEVRVSAALKPTEVRVHGGSVRLVGTPEEIARQLSEWRARRPATSGGGAGLGVSVDGVSLTWDELGDAAAEPLRLWGVRYERDAESEQLGVDLARGSYAGVSIEAEKARVRLLRKTGKRQLEKVEAERVAVSADLDSKAVRRAVQVGVAASAAGAVGSASPAEPPNEGSVAAAVKTGGTLAGRTPPAGADQRAQKGAWSPGRFIDPGRGPRVRGAAARLATAVASVLPPAGELDLSGLHLRLLRGGDSLNVGPARLHVVRGEGGVAIQLAPAPSAEHALRLSLDLPDGPREVKASIAGGPVSLAALGVQEGDFGLREVDKTTLEAKGSAVLSADGAELTWTGSIGVDGIAVEKKWLASSRVRGLSLSLSGKGRLALDGTRLSVERSEIGIGKIRGDVEGEIQQTRDEFQVRLKGAIPLASCQALLDSTPEGLAPLLAGMRANGTFSLSGEIQFDTRDVEKLVTRWSVANECRISDVSADVSPRKFAQSWARVVLGADGRPTTIQSGPGTLSWVPRSAISRHMETAVLICEDAAFFRHRGFDQEAIRNSIRENVKARRFVRGASTVSMQLAKNLYLPREKTLSRKLQEAVLTQLLEQELSKDQILELYLNVIEFGPGIYGIGPAAAYYFNTTADQLSLGQALYLASILPNPKRQYFGADGAVTPGWTAYLRKLMRIASKIRRVSPEELEEALTEQVTFKVPYSPRVLPDGEVPGEESAERTSEPETLPVY